MKEKAKKKNAKNTFKVKIKEKKTYYTCPHCKKKFTDNSSWHSHIRLHTSEDQYSCSQCDYKCKIKKYLSRHVKKVHNKPQGPQCTVCGKCFHYDCNLRDHMRVHTGEKPYKCSVCNKSFSSTYTLSVHKLIHTGEKPYQCRYCDYSCRDTSTIRRHQERHLGVSKNYPCTICNKSFKKKESLQFHVDEVHFELETRTIPCEQCDKVFKTKATLGTHIRAVHLKANIIKCTICGHKVTSNNILAHNRRHIDVKPYKCSFKACGRRFKVKEDLKRHTLIHYPDHHGQCPICHRKFTRRHRLTQHMLLHKIHKRVQCDYCGVTFFSKTYVMKHIKKCHGADSKEYVCHVCGVVNYTRRSMIRHLKYGHGDHKDTECKICKKDYKAYLSLKEHYLVHHHINYTLLEKKKELEVAIKEEPLEQLEVTHEPQAPTKFMYEVEVQKQEVDPEIPEELSLTMMSPINYQIDADTITYSKKVLSEDISRSLIERGKATQDEFDSFFIGHVLKKPEQMIEIPEAIVDEKKEETVEKRLKELLTNIRFRREIKALKRLRKRYNKRIKMATSKGHKKEPKSVIRYFKKPQENIQSKTDNTNDKEVGDDIDKINDDNDETLNDTNINENDAAPDDNINENDKSHNNEDETNKTPDDDKINDIETLDNDKSDQESDADVDDDKDDDYIVSEEEINTSRNIKFHTHQCYICFKLFKTKTELHRHCKEHFAICNGKKVLKKCPYCGYVTNLQINRHIKLVHKIHIKIPYSRIKERDTQNGSKYVYEIDKNCDLEIIPSISNLNKIAAMKIDEKKREKNQLFLGTTKLVRKGGDWAVERQPISVNSEYLLPEFDTEDYEKLIYTGNTYLDRLKNLSLLAKKKGLKILYPCDGCDKICLTFSALKLHDRKHQANPKAFRPKVWKNKILNGYGDDTVKRKKKKPKNTIINNNKTDKQNNKTFDKFKSVGRKKLKVVAENNNTNSKKNNDNTEKAIPNRFADPNPPRNNHNCDRELIQFYYDNIKGGDIEFWQFLKIFNKMDRENVNDFEELESRQDFGIHTKHFDPLPKETVPNEASVTSTTSQRAKKYTNKPANPSISRVPKKTRKNNKKSFTRAIMISKKEYLKRNELKKQMRMKLSQAKV